MQIRYNYSFDKITNTFNFETKNNIVYRVVFIADETFSTISGEVIPNIYQIVIEKTTDEVEPFDAKVSKTVEDIVESFFKNIDNSMIYVCSGQNSKDEVRHKLFDRWYKKSKHKTNILKLDNIIRVDIDKNNIHVLYTSFLFHKENVHYHRLIEIYSQIEKVLTEQK